ncbi:MAG: SecDF P1 head subdomain-containing protein [Phocaeicola sp.]
MKITIYFIPLLFLLSSSCKGESQEAKIDKIIEKLSLFENKKGALKEYRLKSLRSGANEAETKKIDELEAMLTDDEIRRRVVLGVQELFTPSEIEDVYHFVTSSAFSKLSNESSQFDDVESQIRAIEQNINGERESKGRAKFEAIPIDRRDGFYATVDYNSSMEGSEIRLEENPSLTVEDMAEVTTRGSSVGAKIICITFNGSGTKKFHMLTKRNIDKPIAMVIDNHIVSLPQVRSAISEGRVEVGGDFTDEEVVSILNKWGKK